MTTPELPPLELHCESGRAHAAFTMESVEARERILLARIAELEADAERYRWLRTATYLDGETLAVFVIDEASEIANKGEWLSDEQLDDAIDAARKVANHRFLLRRKACKV